MQLFFLIPARNISRVNNYITRLSKGRIPWANTVFFRMHLHWKFLETVAQQPEGDAGFIYIFHILKSRLIVGTVYITPSTCWTYF